MTLLTIPPGLNFWITRISLPHIYLEHSVSALKYVIFNDSYYKKDSFCLVSAASAANTVSVFAQWSVNKAGVSSFLFSPKRFALSLQELSSLLAHITLC